MTDITGVMEFGNVPPTALYRLYAEGGQLLYIGITDDLRLRMRAHRSTKDWWQQVTRTTVEWHPSRADAAAAEKAAIKAEQPCHNILHGPAEPNRSLTQATGPSSQQTEDARGARYMASAALMAAGLYRKLGAEITQMINEQIEMSRRLALEMEALAEPVLGPMALSWSELELLPLPDAFEGVGVGTDVI